MQPIVSTSPDNKHQAILEQLGEIRFGPAYYSLVIDHIFFGDRAFGDSYLWSPDSRFFAIQEWEIIGERHGPRTRLLMIVVESERECVLSWAEKGFIVPERCENDKLIYAKRYFRPPVTKEFEIEFLPLTRWENLK